MASLIRPEQDGSQEKSCGGLASALRTLGQGTCGSVTHREGSKGGTWALNALEASPLIQRKARARHRSLLITTSV